jgi:hypothetical protein
MRNNTYKAIQNQAQAFGLTYVRKGGKAQVRLPAYKRPGALVWDSHSGARQVGHPDAKAFLETIGAA